MQPVVVMPMHDPSGLMFPHLEAVTPQLKRIFGRAFVSVPPPTRQRQARYMGWLETDGFFDVTYLPAGDSVRDEFVALYTRAAVACPPDHILHLCFIDRVAFALQTTYCDQFTADVLNIASNDVPLIFQRSERAWETHPRNYRELEQMVTRTGEFFFGKRLDFGWCHLAIQGRQLKAILPHVRNRDISMVAEMVLLLKDSAKTKDVDWLAWEDPFIFCRDAGQLKQEREQSVAETHKRLAYVIPMLKLLDDAANGKH